MSETAPTPDDANSVEKLTEALRKERDAHKSTRASLLGPIREALGLTEEATAEEVAQSIATRLGDSDARLAEATATVTAERDEARAEVERIAADRKAERIGSALATALGKSSMIPENATDALAIMRPLFDLDANGRVVTRGGDSGEPGGLDPAQWIISRLTALRPHWFNPSVGGGARPVGSLPIPTGAAEVFRSNNLTEQSRWVQQHGEAAARDVCRRLGIRSAWFGGASL